MSTIPSLAQRHFYPNMPPDDAARYEGPVYGVKGGVNLPRLYYTSTALSDLPHELLLTPSAGFFLELPLSRMVTIAPELHYQQRGGATSYQFNGQQESYRFIAHYVTLRVPFYCYAPVSDRWKPYLFLAPEAGSPIFGKIQLKRPSGDVETDINNANINRIYLGALGGIGMRINIPFSTITMVLKIETALNWGLIDTYSPSEHAGTAHPVNIQAYSIEGHRWSRGLECHLGLGFFINKYNACSTFQ